MSIVTILLGSFLSVAAGTLKDIQDLNVENDSKKNILTCLGYKQDIDKPWTSSDIKKIFDNNIEMIFTKKENHPIYVDRKDGIVRGYAIPISGKGLWSTLYGYFAVEPDGMTAKGITFYAHKETPGLGGEVDKAWFKDNFIGKRFVNYEGELVGIKVIKGKADPESEYEVDGISGATITSKGVETFLATDLKKYETFFKNLRKG
tara:strand:+ start:53 stop:664 length:612 start_codon:yes stop_codon:yes gene_type:complete